MHFFLKKICFQPIINIKLILQKQQQLPHLFVSKKTVRARSFGRYWEERPNTQTILGCLKISMKIPQDCLQSPMLKVEQIHLEAKFVFFLVFMGKRDKWITSLTCYAFKINFFLENCIKSIKLRCLISYFQQKHYCKLNLKLH